MRFGWRTPPTERLARQKEWLHVDETTQTVLRDISRQPLESLRRTLDQSSSGATATYVNLGSFAASHDFLRIASSVFQARTNDVASCANWDPYFWQALQCETRAAWERLVAFEERTGAKGALELLAGFPDFYETVCRFKAAFAALHGRKPRVSILDFGEPYWIDVGSHVALSRALADVFAPSDAGDALRAFLGLPGSLAAGRSFVAASHVPARCRIEGSVVLGASIAQDSSQISGSIVLGSKLGRVCASRGATISWCRASDLSVKGPHGMAFRLDTQTSVVRGTECATTILLGKQRADLRYDRRLGNIEADSFFGTVLDNRYSFSEAAELVMETDPTELYADWCNQLELRGL